MDNPDGLPGDAGVTSALFQALSWVLSIIGKANVCVALGARLGLKICLGKALRAKISGSLGISPWKLPFKEVIYVRGHKNRWQTVSCCRWRKN